VDVRVLQTFWKRHQAWRDLAKRFAFQKNRIARERAERLQRTKAGRLKVRGGLAHSRQPVTAE
jgi:hypothetical protein